MARQWPCARATGASSTVSIKEPPMSKPFVLALLSSTFLAVMATGAMATTVRGSGQAAATESGPANPGLVPSGKGWGVAPKTAAQTPGGQAGTQITYHGGPVMADAAGVNVYFIWYGNWATQSPTGKSIITSMINSAGGQPYFNTNSTYYQSSNTPANQVKNIITLKGAIDDATMSQGAKLSDAKVKTIVSNAISSGKLPKDPKGVYFVLTTKDVNETSGFCSQYCGWHTHASILSTDIKYSFVGDAARCLSSCAAQSTSPNNNPGVDGMASVLMHELEEAASDPDLNAWYDGSGAENADKCAWTFGTTFDPGNGSMANVTWGGSNYLIQRNWVNSGTGFCAMQYP
jgi:hypothetical protein